LVASIAEGTAFAAHTSTAGMPRFALEASRVSHDQVAVRVSGMPAPVRIQATRTADIALELLYDPACKCASLRRNGRPLASNLQGDTKGAIGEFRFGVSRTSNSLADVSFRTAMLEVRH
jgi:hypothetical protein